VELALYAVRIILKICVVNVSQGCTDGVFESRMKMRITASITDSESRIFCQGGVKKSLAITTAQVAQSQRANLRVSLPVALPGRCVLDTGMSQPGRVTKARGNALR
jgi:hypothetical protein